jgi:hypothetical protein
MSKRLFGATILSVLALCVACGDTTATSGEDGSEGPDSERRLHVPEQLELCAVSPIRFEPAFADATVFEFRGVLTLGDGAPFDIELGRSSGEAMAGWIPFDLWTAPGEDNHIVGVMGNGSAWVEEGLVPSSVYAIEEIPGYETAFYADKFPVGDSKNISVLSDRLIIEVANMSGDEVFDLSDASSLDAERRMAVYGFVEGIPDTENYRVRMAPCQVEDVVIDRYDVTLSEGMVSFHTRPAWWREFNGFTTLAEGHVDDIEFSVNRYWDLEYSTGEASMGGWYGALPVMGVRFGEQPDGSCSLIVEEDSMTFDGTFTARILDCQGTVLRELTVESVDIVPGGGTSEPMVL